MMLRHLLTVCTRYAFRDAAARVRDRRLERVEKGFLDWTEAERKEFARLTARFNDAMRDELNEA